MKKLFLLTAAFAMTLFASCTKEEMAPQANETTVTYTVEIPDALVKGGDTKAIGDGMNINQLIYEVWKTKNADEQDLLDPSKECVRLYQKTAPMVKVGDQIRTVISLNLVQDQEYTILFWAQVKDADAYVTDELTNVTYKYNAAAGEYLSNREDMAAFYGVDFVSDSDPKAKTVYLKRPFAQLNLGTKNTATDYKITMNTTEVVIDNVPTAFNVAKKIALDNAPVAFKFSHGNVPTDPATITVNNQVYEYAAMNYIFAADRGNGGQTATVSYAIKTTLTSKNLDGTPGATTEAIVTNTVENVPLKENFRTNIIGNLLTSTTDYEVIIDASWADEGDGEIVEVWDGKNVQEPYYNPTTQQYEISLATELAWLSSAVNGTLDIETKAASNAPRTFEGETFVLKEDVDLKGKLWVPIGAKGNFKGTFDGNGKTIKNLTIKVDDKTPAGLFSDAYSVKNVKVENATIEAHYKTGVIVGDGLCTRIEKCAVSNATITVTPLNKDDANHVGGIVGYLSGEPTAYVKNCTVENATIKGYRDIAAIAGTANKTAVVEGNKAANVTIIADQTPEYVDNTKDGNAGAIAGRISTEATVKDDNVAGDNIVIKRYVDSTEELAAAVADAKDGDVIYLGEGEVSIPSVAKGKKLNIEGLGNGKSTIKVASTGSEKLDYNLEGSTVTFTKVNFLTSNSGAGYENGYCRPGKLIYNECSFPTTYALYGNDEFHNCTFNISGDKYNVWTWGGKEVLFQDCTFNSDGKSVLLYGYGPTTLTMNNCIFNDNGDNTITDKAAIEIGNDYDATYSLIVNNATVNGFAINPKGTNTGTTLWANKNSMTPDKLSVTIDGVKWTGNAGLYEDENGNPVVMDSDGLNKVLDTESTQLTVTLKAGNYTFPAANLFKPGFVVKCEEGTVFTGSSSLNIKGATVIGATFSNKSGNASSGTINGTFKDCTFDGYNGLRNSYAGETVVFENCVFTGDLYGAHFDGGANDIIFKNCTFSGFNAFAAAVTLITFDECTFKSNGRSGYNGANLWGSTKMINTKFEFDGSCGNEWIDAIGTDKSYEFTGCTLNGGSIINTNYIWSRNSGTKLIIDNVEYTYTNDYLVSNGIATVCNNDGLTAALKDGETNINLIPGTYEGIFTINNSNISSADVNNKAIIKGRVELVNPKVKFKNIKFDYNDDSKVEFSKAIVGNPKNHPAIVGIYGGNGDYTVFENCDFNFKSGYSTASAPGAITHYGDVLLRLTNCTLDGDGNPIYAKTNIDMQGCSVKMYGSNAVLSLNYDQSNHSIIFKNNTITNKSTNGAKMYGMQFLSTNGKAYKDMYFDVQGNTGIDAMYVVGNGYTFENPTYADGSEKIN